MTDNRPDTIAVTVDKSHIVTIGERLYSESIELVRELINNAYDADASEVRLVIDENQIAVEDNGSGMDIDGLRQYFNIGSTVKRGNPVSPKFKRSRIGEFGIGKFASLSACSRFEVWTKKGEFQARVTFDKKEWENSGDKWHLPLEIEAPDNRLKDGTRITLFGINKKFALADIEKRIIEAVPIKAENFAVYINGRKVNPRMAAGHRIPFLEGTEFGIVHGEIVIAPAAEQDISDAGIECKVKQVTVTRDFFGLEKWVANIARIRGEVNADFLSVTSDRSGFIKDTPQYAKFLEVMQQVVERARPILDELADRKENKRVRRSLSEVMEKVRTGPFRLPPGIVTVPVFTAWAISLIPILNAASLLGSTCTRTAPFAPHTWTWESGRTWASARSWASAWAPQPMSPTTRLSRRARTSAATAAAAAVRNFVTSVPSITASGTPVAGSFMMMTAITVGKPRRRLCGWTLTHLRPHAAGRCKYAGIARKSLSCGSGK